jgi:O-antigen/teichoic acid export membrane protein
MVGGIILGAVVALAVLAVLWRRRRAIVDWLITRNRGTKLAMVGAVVPCSCWWSVRA